MVPVLVYAFKMTGMVAEHVVTMALGTSMAAIVFLSGKAHTVIIARAARRSRRSAAKFTSVQLG